MFKKGGVEKRLRKISKQEAESVKLLEKQEEQLEKALQENEKIIEKSLSKVSPAELKVQQEVERLTRKLSELTSRLEELRSRREEEVKPLRSRGLELSEKLENVKSQLLSARNGRERSLSLTSLDLRNTGKLELSMGSSRYCSEDPSVPPPPYNEDY